MKIQYIIIIILVILLIATVSMLYRGIGYYKKYENFRMLKYVKISNIYDDLKSGDIILYKCNTISLPSVFLTHVYFSHIGIVLKNNGNIKGSKNELFISETNPGFEYIPGGDSNEGNNKDSNGKDSNEGNNKDSNEDNNKDSNEDNNKDSNGKDTKANIIKGHQTNYGSDILPFLIRIKYYPGDCFIVRLNKPLDEKRENELIKYAHEECPYPTILQGLNIFIEQSFGKQKTRARHCFQHVGYLLDKINITNNMSSNGIYSICKKMANIHKEELNDGYQYEMPIKILYDIA